MTSFITFKKAYIQSPAFSMKSHQSVKEVLYKKWNFAACHW